MRRYNPISLLRLYIRARLSAHHAAKRGLIGMEFNQFGHNLGCRLLIRACASGLGYLLNPVSSTRYFEFAFARSCLSGQPERCLDVSSPRLFSLYLADRELVHSILMVNPDIRDLCCTTRIVHRLGIDAIDVECQTVDFLSSQRETYDCIWAISVIEHIAGKYGDTGAVKLMYGALKEGGTLILTVPVDRHFWNEYRDKGYYGTQGKPMEEGKYFFQHFYDKAAIQERLLSPIEQQPRVMRWFGETSPGRFHDYIQRWICEGYNCTVEDAREMVNNYREFASWEKMPGVGVCGLAIKKH